MKMLSKTMRWLARQSGYALVRCQKANGYPVDFSDEEIALVRKVAPYTKTTPERLWALVHAVEYIESRGIEGAIVECGVWRGGSMMAAAEALLKTGYTGRDLYLFDTYTGMVAPSEHDVSHKGITATEKFEKRKTGDDSSDWCLASREEVGANMKSTGYPDERVHLVEGKVEDTIPAEAPERIALLRLDTDWYESTKHEMETLYPRLVPGGILILDDYGDWAGSRKAVDEYFANGVEPPLLNRIDDSARIAVKVADR